MRKKVRKTNQSSQNDVYRLHVERSPETSRGGYED